MKAPLLIECFKATLAIWINHQINRYPIGIFLLKCRPAIRPSGHPADCLSEGVNALQASILYVTDSYLVHLVALPRT